MAEWHGMVRRRVPLALAIILLTPLTPRAAEVSESEARLKKDVTFLASDECEGRGVTTRGINLAADYVAGEFRKAGLKPAGADGGFFQPFTMTGQPKLGSPNTVTLTGPLGQRIELAAGTHFAALGFAKAGVVTAPVVFAGYGITAPDVPYDDYEGIDVAGKVVVVLRKTPRADDAAAPFAGPETQMFAALNTKAVTAEKHKAAGLIYVNDAGTGRDGDPLMTFAYSSQGAGAASVPAVHLRRAVLNDMIQASLGVSLADMEKDIDRGLSPRSAVLAGWTVRLEVNVTRPALHVKNVVGVLEGEGPRADETVVLGAHYDHLGMGGMGSLARLQQPAIHHGADDNASGTAALMELARRLARTPHRERRLVFIAFSGEESGLLGSAYYCRNPVFPLDKTVAMVNLDMVGRLRPDPETGKGKLQIHGIGTAKTFKALVERLNGSFDFKLQEVASGFGPSDHASFYSKKIPVLFFFTGDHPDYHRPSDTADKINVAGMLRVTDLAEAVARELLRDDRPEYVEVKGSSRPISGGRGGPRLGIRPGYGDDGGGVLVDGVIPGGAAAKAGIKDGDRIVTIGGQSIKNLEGYMVQMGRHKKGEPLEVVVLRGGRKVAMKVVPE